LGVAVAALAAGAVPFYGPLPSNAAGLATTRSAVLAIYAEQDTRITASWPDAETQLKKSGAPYAQKVEPGVGHAFHNDTNGPTRYGPAQAQDAWVATIEWFRTYLGS
jgi:carboxymethylenebutenolidase